MQPSVVAMVLVAAVLHAAWNALLKIREERLAVMALLNAWCSVIAFVAIPFLPFPAKESWHFLLTSIVFHAGYMFFLLHAYRHGDLGQVYPIARGSAPILVTLISAAFLGEVVDWHVMVGVLVITGAVLSLAFRGRRPLREQPGPLVYALLTALFIGGYTVTDGLGARASGAPVSYTMWLFLLDGFPITAFAIWHYRRESLAIATRNWAVGLIAGAMSLAAYGLAIWALAHAPLGPVAALRETSVVIAALFGTLFLKEGHAAWRLTAAAAVACGVIILRL